MSLTQDTTSKIRIDEELKNLIPPLSEDEFFGLEQSILSEMGDVI